MGLLGNQIRPENVEQVIKAFENYMDYEKYDLAKQELDQLEALLGKEHPDVSTRKAEYMMEAMEE